MSGALHLIQTHFSHVCAFVVLATLLGGIRLAGSIGVVGRRPNLARGVGLAWLAMLLVLTYALPPLGLWAVGVVVPLLADSHFQAWVAERLGREAAIRNTVEIIRTAGPAKYFVIGSTSHLLHGVLGLIIVAVSTGRNSWEYWLGMGVLASAGLGVFGYALVAWQYRGAGTSGEAAQQADAADEAQGGTRNPS